MKKIIYFFSFIAILTSCKNAESETESIENVKTTAEVEKQEFAFIGNHSHSHEYLINYEFKI